MAQWQRNDHFMKVQRSSPVTEEGKKRRKEMKLGSEELQAVFLIQVPAPELFVVLVVCVALVNGRSAIACELRCRADDCTIARAKEGGDGHPLFA